MRESTGSFWKRGDDRASNVDDGVGACDNTCRKRAATLAMGLTDEKSRDGVAADLSTMGAAGSGPEVIRTSCHPLCVLYGKSVRLKNR